MRLALHRDPGLAVVVREGKVSVVHVIYLSLMRQLQLWADVENAVAFRKCYGIVVRSSLHCHRRVHPETP